jgi:hypothetical protein
VLPQDSKAKGATAAVNRLAWAVENRWLTLGVRIPLLIRTAHSTGLLRLFANQQDGCEGGDKAKESGGSGHGRMDATRNGRNQRVDFLDRHVVNLLLL